MKSPLDKFIVLQLFIVFVTKLGPELNLEEREGPKLKVADPYKEDYFSNFIYFICYTRQNF